MFESGNGVSSAPRSTERQKAAGACTYSWWRVARFGRPPPSRIHPTQPNPIVRPVFCFSCCPFWLSFPSSLFFCCLLLTLLLFYSCFRAFCCLAFLLLFVLCFCVVGSFFVLFFRTVFLVLHASCSCISCSLLGLPSFLSLLCFVWRFNGGLGLARDGQRTACLTLTTYGDHTPLSTRLVPCFSFLD